MKICVVGAHPDDIAITCAGTVAKYVKLGHEVTKITMTCGDKGNPEKVPEEASKERLAEGKKAAEVMGAKYINLGEKDGEIYDNHETRQKIIEILKQERPDIVLTHFPDDYNLDHNVTSRIVFAASLFATLPWSSQLPTLQKITRMYYFEPFGSFSFNPEIYVDITDTFETKLKAISAYESQIRFNRKWSKIDLLEYARVVNRLRGIQCGVTYAEGFVPLMVTGRVRTVNLIE